MYLEITIPVLNEETTLEVNVKKTVKFLRASNIEDFGIVIADNGSTDNTSSIGKILEKEIDEVKYLKLHKKGVGLALRTSWVQSNSDIVGYMDLDLATDLKHLGQMYDLFNTTDVDVVNGSRLLKDSIVNNRSFIREITSRGFNIVARLLLGYSITDGMCGFKFLKSNVAKELINTGIHTDGWIFSTEMLAKSDWKGYKTKEIPVRWTDDGTSKVKIINLTIEYLKHLIKLNKAKKNWIRTNQNDL